MSNTETITENELKLIKRDENGLIEGVGYIFNEDGSINWRKMVDPQYIAINEQRTTKTDISEVKDEDLIIRLAGLKKLLRIRGFKTREFRPVVATPSYVSTVCRITFIANYETEGQEISYEAMADASNYNTFDFAVNYLSAIAENRAFARCIRSFLGIDITAEEEIGPKQEPSAEPSEESNQHRLADVFVQNLKAEDMSLEKFKKMFIKKYHKPDSKYKVESDPATWEKIEDIPLVDLYTLNTLISDKKKE